jgi:uncharacterized protein YjbI with pentapeptide repeats
VKVSNLAVDIFDDSDFRKRSNEDQRHHWWAAYGASSGLEYQDMPSELDKGALVEITAQPLLNYLVALSFARGKLDFTKDNNINVIYSDLLQAVYQRVWGQPHPSIRDITEEEFFRILEEIALAAWHGDGRTTTLREVEEHCAASGLSPLLLKFQEGAKKGLWGLLMAFYFRMSGNRVTGDETFEFTHKSFGEYLMAKRIVRSIKRIDSELKRRRDFLDSGWDEREALNHWIKICGLSLMDLYLFSFVLNEISLYGEDDDTGHLEDWQESLGRLVTSTLYYGMPVEALSPRPSLQEEIRQVRNAGEALLACLNACARETEKLSVIHWPTRTAFGTWLSLIQGQRLNFKETLLFECLSWLDLSGVTLVARDLQGANLTKTKLERADLRRAQLQYARMDDAQLQESQMQGAQLQGAKVRGINLRNANLEGAQLQRINLRGVDLRKAHLRGANLQSAKLTDVQLQEANLSGAQMQYAKLLRVNLQSAKLRETNLRKAKVRETDLQSAQLQKADLQGAWLHGAQLQDADLSYANLERANCILGQFERAQMRGTDLREARLQKANLRCARMRGVILQRSQLQVAQLDGADLSNAHLQGAQLQRAQLGRTNLSGASLQGANLREVQMQGADLRNANLQKADLQKANLDNAIISEADFTDAKFLQTVWVNGNMIDGTDLGSEDLLKPANSSPRQDGESLVEESETIDVTTDPSGESN